MRNLKGQGFVQRKTRPDQIVFERGQETVKLEQTPNNRWVAVLERAGAVLWRSKPHRSRSKADHVAAQRVGPPSDFDFR